MAKLNDNYEAMVVFSLKEGEENVKALTEKFKNMISSEATLKNVDEWGKRKLAYDINYESEGYYVLYTFNAAPAFPAELDRVLKITDGVMRSMITVSVSAE